MGWRWGWRWARSLVMLTLCSTIELHSYPHVLDWKIKAHRQIQDPFTIQKDINSKLDVVAHIFICRIRNSKSSLAT